MTEKFVEELFNSLGDKINISTNLSYTAKLVDKPELLAKKLGKNQQSLL